MATGHTRKRINSKGEVTYQIIVETEKDLLTGKRDRHYKSIKGTKKQAEAVLRKLIEEVENGGIAKESSVKLSDWMAQWLELYLPNIAETTRAGYKNKINLHINPHIGNIPLKTLNTNTIQGWINFLKDEKGLSPKSIKNTYLNLKAALDKAVVLKMITYNPCTGVVLPALKKYKANIYNKNEINNILEKSKGTELYLVILIASYFGLRRGEIAALTWDNVDFDNKILHIRKSTVLAGGKKITKAPKTEAGIRDLTFGDNILSELKNEHSKYLRQKLALGKDFIDSNLVISKETGEAYSPDSITQMWERFLKKYKLKSIRLHDLRHSCATMMAEVGVSPKVMQKRLGHSDVSVTMNIYTHVTANMDREVADKMDDIFHIKKAN